MSLETQQAKRWATPMLYGITVIPLFLLSVLAEMLVQALATTTQIVYGREFQIQNSFAAYAPVVFLLLILALWTVTFWQVSKFMYRTEKIEQPAFIDHLRQSSMFYVYLAGYALFELAIHTGKLAPLTQRELLGMALLAAISFWAIFINARYLLHKHRVSKLQI